MYPYIVIQFQKINLIYPQTSNADALCELYEYDYRHPQNNRYILIDWKKNELTKITIPMQDQDVETLIRLLGGNIGNDPYTYSTYV